MMNNTCPHGNFDQFDRCGYCGEMCYQATRPQPQPPQPLDGASIMVSRAANEIWQLGVAKETRRESRQRWLRRVVVLGAALALGTVVFSVQAQSQTPPRLCSNASDVAKQLTQQYDEAPVAFGLQANGNLLQVYSSEERGTWTVVSTSPSGVSCIVAAGKRWEQLPVSSKDPLA